MKFQLKLLNVHWINGANEDIEDLCLHGNVFVKIGNEVVDDGIINGDWTVSAGAYRMLESLYNDHISGNEEHLLPCCGHFMFIDEKTNNLVISGCPNGLDWSVVHESNEIKLITDSNTQIIISLEEYKIIVFEFADKIEAFYNKCSPKFIHSDFDNDNFQKFWEKWKKMRYPAV